MKGRGQSTFLASTRSWVRFLVQKRKQRNPTSASAFTYFHHRSVWGHRSRTMGPEGSIHSGKPWLSSSISCFPRTFHANPKKHFQAPSELSPALVVSHSSWGAIVWWAPVLGPTPDQTGNVEIHNNQSKTSDWPYKKAPLINTDEDNPLIPPGTKAYFPVSLFSCCLQNYPFCHVLQGVQCVVHC